MSTFPPFDRNHPGFVPYYGGERRQRNAPGWIKDENGCHIWVGSRRKGYGRVYADGRLQEAHRVRFRREVGPIPEGMDLDHYVCDNGAGGCCNPHHCRPATSRDNVMRGNGACAQNARKIECKRGHALWKIGPKGYRICRICTREDMRRYRARKRAQWKPT